MLGRKLKRIFDPKIMLLFLDILLFVDGATIFISQYSIVDFQRVMGGKVVFELPANPLVVPQMCLRFNDVENVGLMKALHILLYGRADM